MATLPKILPNLGVGSDFENIRIKISDSDSDIFLGRIKLQFCLQKLSDSEKSIIKILIKIQNSYRKFKIVFRMKIENRKFWFLIFNM